MNQHEEAIVPRRLAVVKWLGAMTKLKPLPIIVGILIDTVGSIVLGVLYFIGIFSFQTAGGKPPNAEVFATPHLIVTELVGLFLTAAGGFVAARMARTRHVQHGVAVGAGALLVWLALEWITPRDTLPVGWYEMASFMGIVPAGALGGYIAKRADMLRGRSAPAMVMGGDQDT